MNKIEFSSIFEYGVFPTKIAAVHKEHKKGVTERSAAFDDLLLYVTDSVIYSDKENKWTLLRGDILYVPKGISYTIDFVTSADTICVSFRLLSEEGAPVSVFDRAERIFSDTEFVYLEMFSLLPTVYLSTTDRFALYTAFCELVGTLARAYAAKVATPVLVSVADDIRDNIREDLRVTTLSARAGMGESTLRREFSTHFSISPKQYILERKLAKAKDMLATDFYEIKEICELLGFWDDAYFSKLFKRETGMTPLSYRRKALLRDE